MRRAIFIALSTGGIISGAAALGIDAQDNVAAERLTHRDYRASMRAIAARAAEANAACERIAASDRESCHARVEAEQAWHEAELQVSWRHDGESARRAQRARIEARYHVERAQCAALGGARRDSCLIDAHAHKGRAMLEAAAPYIARS